MGEKKYSVILADPPWHYKVYSKKGAGRSAESHYPTMNIEDIKALPVAGIADRDCALFLWVTFPCLLEGLEVLKAWGFTYKTVAFVWVKQNKKSASLFWGMGYWTRSNVELCILATRADRNVSVQECIRWCYHTLRNTAESQQKYTIELTSLWAAYQR